MFRFSEPWHPCSDKSFEEELHREVCDEHVLHGIELRVIARRQDMDDFLFALPDGRFANVHLTWSQETDPLWPSTEIYETQEIMEAEIKRQVDEWDDLGSLQ